MTGRQFARLRGEANVPLAMLQLASRPTGAWSIVPRPPKCRAPTSWGPRYAVCPNCQARAPLPKGPVSMKCGGCNGVFEVGWGDSYYA